MPSIKKRKVKLVVRTASGTKRSRSFRMAGTLANPKPPLSRTNINSDTTKFKTFARSVVPMINSMTTAGLQLDSIDRGTSDLERVGSKWKVLAVHFRGSVQGSMVAGGVPLTTAGYFVVWDKQPNKAAALFGDVFSGSDAASSFALGSNDDRFVILKHRRFNITMQDSTGDANDNSQHQLDDYIKLGAGKVCHSTLGTTSGIIANRTTGALLLFPYSDKASGAFEPVMSFGYRTYFEDC
jgi:hypothetical protein